MKTPAGTCEKCREAIRLGVMDALPAEQRAAVDQHQAACADCRAYEQGLRAAAAGLRRLATRPVEPSPHFRARWTAAVRRADAPGSLAETLAVLAAWSRQFVWANRRALAVLGPVWLLILVFRLTAPEVGRVSPTIEARSPVDLVLAMKAQERRWIAFEHSYREPEPARPPAASPRSSVPLTRPTASRRETETDRPALVLA
jgi:hypothetical protein